MVDLTKELIGKRVLWSRLGGSSVEESMVKAFSPNGDYVDMKDPECSYSKWHTNRFSSPD